MQKEAFLAGRILLCMIFFASALGKIFDFTKTAGFMASKGMPMTSVLLVGAIVFLLAGSLMIMLGFQARIGAVLLMLFLIPATLIFHNFWTLQGQARTNEMIMFMKNMGIMGGLLIVFASGSGPYSLDNRKSS